MAASDDGEHAPPSAAGATKGAGRPKKPAAKRSTRPAKGVPAKKAASKKSPSKKSTTKRRPAVAKPARPVSTTAVGGVTLPRVQILTSDDEVVTGSEAEFADDWGPDEDWGSLGWGPEDESVENERAWDSDDDTNVGGDDHAGEDGSGDGDRFRDGPDVLQAAAREFISAARTMLDVAEEVVSDPRGLGPALSTLAGLTNDLLRSAAHTSPMAHWRGDDATTDEDPDDGFQRIHVD